MPSGYVGTELQAVAMSKAPKSPPCASAIVLE